MSAYTYEQDYYAWTREQAALLRAGRFTALDADHLAEELDSMGASERQQLTSRLKVLMAHMLKWQYQSHLQSRSWSATPIKHAVNSLIIGNSHTTDRLKPRPPPGGRGFSRSVFAARQRTTPGGVPALKEQCLSIQNLLDDNPSLRAILDQRIAKAYRLARLLAVRETNLEEQSFPEQCPYSWEQIIDESYYPVTADVRRNTLSLATALHVWRLMVRMTGMPRAQGCAGAADD